MVPSWSYLFLKVLNWNKAHLFVMRSKVLGTVVHISRVCTNLVITFVIFSPWKTYTANNMFPLKYCFIDKPNHIFYTADWSLNFRINYEKIWPSLISNLHTPFYVLQVRNFVMKLIAENDFLKRQFFMLGAKDSPFWIVTRHISKKNV